jgi:hypothetical protein
MPHLVHFAGTISATSPFFQTTASDGQFLKQTPHLVQASGVTWYMNIATHTPV